MSPFAQDLSKSVRTVLRALAISIAGAAFLTGSMFGGFRLVKAITGSDDRSAFLIGQPLGILFAVLVGLGVMVFRQNRRERLRREATGRP